VSKDPLEEIIETLGQLHGVLAAGAHVMKRGRKIAKAARGFWEEDAPRTAAEPAGRRPRPSPTPAADVDLERDAPPVIEHPASMAFHITRPYGDRLRFGCKRCGQGFLVRERAARNAENMLVLQEHVVGCAARATGGKP